MRPVPKATPAPFSSRSTLAPSVFSVEDEEDAVLGDMATSVARLTQMSHEIGKELDVQTIQLVRAEFAQLC